MRTKILLTIAIFFSIAATTFGQINKGTLFLGGDIGYSNSKSSDPVFYPKQQNINAGIRIGEVIQLNTVVGLIGYYNYTNNIGDVSPDSNFNKSNGFSAGIFYRKYKRLLKDFYFFGEVDGLYSYSDNHQRSTGNQFYDERYKTYAGIISFVLGLSYAVCKKMQVELLMPFLISIEYLKYNKTNVGGITGVETKFSGHSFSANANLNSNFLSNVQIGFKFFL